MTPGEDGTPDLPPEPLTGREWSIWCAGFVQLGHLAEGSTVGEAKRRASYADRCLRKYREHVADDVPSYLKDARPKG